RCLSSPPRIAGSSRKSHTLSESCARRRSGCKLGLLAYSQTDINLRCSDRDEGTDVAAVRAADAVRTRDRAAAARAGDRIRDAARAPGPVGTALVRRVARATRRRPACTARALRQTACVRTPRTTPT